MRTTRSQTRASRDNVKFRLVATEAAGFSGPEIPTQTNNTLSYRDRLKQDGVLGCIRRTFIKFVFACCIYLLSWSSILCRITRGLVKYPDRMPMAVWVITLGLLLLYETFIVSECTSIFVRIRHATQAVLRAGDKDFWASLSPWDLDRVAVRFFSLGNLRDPFSISLIGASIGIDLIGVIVYSIPSIRDFLGIPKDTQPSESWSVLALLLVIWALFLYSRQAKQTAWIRRQSEKKQFLIYNTCTVGLVLLWGWLILGTVGSSMGDHGAVGEGTEWIWLLVVSGLVSALSLVAVKQTAIEQWPENPYTVTAPSEDTPRDKETEAKEAVEDLAETHGYAVYFHGFLIALTCSLFFMQSDTELDYWNDYIGLRLPTYFFTLDYEMMDAVDTVSTVDTVKQINWCASRADMPVFAVVLSLCWSTLSMLQHWFSRNTLRAAVAEADPAEGAAAGTEDDHDDANSPQSRRWRATKVVVWVSAAGTAAVTVTAGLRNGWGVMGCISFAGFLFALCAPVLLLFTVGMFELYPETTEQSYAVALEHTSRFKWSEYTFSATLMHVVVLLYSNIYSSHEVVLSAGLLAISLSTVHTVEAEMSRLPRGELDVCTRAALEKPFVHLSFWSKGVLCLALTVPLLFYEKRDFEVAPVWCS